LIYCNKSTSGISTNWRQGETDVTTPAAPINPLC